MVTLGMEAPITQQAKEMLNNHKTEVKCSLVLN